MKHKKNKRGSFATAKLQAKRRSLLAIAAIIAVIGLSFIACDDSSGNDKKNNDKIDDVLKLPPELGEEEYIEYPLNKGYNVWGGQVYQKGWAIGGIRFEGLDWASPEAPQSYRPAEDVGYDIEMFRKATKLAILMPNASYPKSDVDIIWGGEDINDDPVELWSQRWIFRNDVLNADVAEKYGNVLIIDLTKAFNNYDIYRSETTVKLKIILQVNAPSFGNVEGLVRKASLLIPKTSPEETFISIDALKTYLSDKGSGVYNIKLNVNDLSGDYDTAGSLGEALIDIADSGIYVNLDLSESTFAGNSIEDWAFFDCASLKNITIPNSVTRIGDFVFENCASLNSVTIPNKVASIGDFAFANCTSLNYITIPNSVTQIGKGIFANCANLTGITMGSNVTSIGFETFFGCTSLTDITIGSKVTSIGARAFYGCASLTDVTLPESVASIGARAFSDCASLISVTFQGTIISDKLGSIMGVDIGSATFTSPFDGDLSEKYLEGGIGTYNRIGDVWTKQN